METHVGKSKGRRELKAGDREVLTRRARKARLDTMERHVLVCAADDCSKGGESAKRMRHRLNSAKARSTVNVTTVSCLGVCEKGPICVVYPEGTWYAKVSGTAVDRIVDEHLLDGTPVADQSFHRNDLS
jgi:(2Fe-2S) ferredoxin